MVLLFRSFVSAFFFFLPETKKKVRKIGKKTQTPPPIPWLSVVSSPLPFPFLLPSHVLFFFETPSSLSGRRRSFSLPRNTRGVERFHLRAKPHGVERSCHPRNIQRTQRRLAPESILVFRGHGIVPGPRGSPMFFSMRTNRVPVDADPVPLPEEARVRQGCPVRVRPPLLVLWGRIRFL